MYTAAVYNVFFFWKTQQNTTPSAALHVFGVQKGGKYHMVLLHFASYLLKFPPLYSFYCYNRYKYRNTQLTRDVHKFTCHIWNVIIATSEKVSQYPVTSLVT